MAWQGFPDSPGQCVKQKVAKDAKGILVSFLFVLGVLLFILVFGAAESAGEWHAVSREPIL